MDRKPATPDSGLVRLLVRANAIRDQLLADRSLTFEDIAKSEGVVPSYATRLFRLTVLAPDIVSALLSGKHPPELTQRRPMTTNACRSIGMSSGAVLDVHRLSESRANRPSIGHLSFCVSLSQRESGCQARDCRTTKLRERDGSAASTANAAGIRLCMKTVVGRPVRSAGISETIRTPAKADITAMSDT